MGQKQKASSKWGWLGSEGEDRAPLTFPLCRGGLCPPERWAGRGNPFPSQVIRSSVTLPCVFAITKTVRFRRPCWVHGWNWADWQKKAYGYSTFKRLYWLGYKGTFGIYKWPGTYGMTAALTFDDSERHALLSGEGLKALILGLKGRGFNAENKGSGLEFRHRPC